MAILWDAPVRCLPLRGLNSDRFAGAAVCALLPAGPGESVIIL